jgi:hypothetical protein
LWEKAQFFSKTLSFFLLCQNLVKIIFFKKKLKEKWVIKLELTSNDQINCFLSKKISFGVLWAGFFHENRNIKGKSSLCTGSSGRKIVLETSVRSLSTGFRCVQTGSISYNTNEKVSFVYRVRCGQVLLYLWRKLENFV